MVAHHSTQKIRILLESPAHRRLHSGEDGIVARSQNSDVCHALELVADLRNRSKKIVQGRKLLLLDQSVREARETGILRKGSAHEQSDGELLELHVEILSKE